MIHADFFGYDAVLIDEEWYWADTREPISVLRKCSKCKKPPTRDGHDPCIADLPGVRYACCGHGTDKKPSIVLEDRETRVYVVEFESVPDLLHFVNVGASDPKKILEDHPDIPAHMLEHIQERRDMKQIHLGITGDEDD